MGCPGGKINMAAISAKRSMYRNLFIERSNIVFTIIKQRIVLCGTLAHEKIDSA